MARCCENCIHYKGIGKNLAPLCAESVPYPNLPKERPVGSPHHCAKWITNTPTMRIDDELDTA